MSLANCLDNILFASATSLFKAYGVAVSETGKERIEPAAPSCAIGFLGQSLTGTVVLTADPEVLRHSKPLETSADRDWLGELTNQLMGRVKNRLLAYGVEVQPTTPVVLRGERLVPLGRNGELSGVVLRHPSGGIVVATIDHEVLDAAGLSQLKRVEGLQLPREGDVILF